MKFLSYGVMIYMLMALIWWTILLTKNNRILQDKSIALATNEILKSSSDLDQDLSTHPAIIQIQKEHQKKKNMILGEGMVFGISLIIGMWFIQRAYNKGIDNTNKQKNFLLSVTHELKSPIAAINLITQTLLKRSLPKEKVDDLHASILSESTRLEKLIGNLLLASKINNAYPYNFESIDMVQIIENIIKTTKLQYPDVIIHFKSTDEHMYLNADKEALVSVVTNLLENSIKYSPTPAYLEINVKYQTKSILLEVADQGFGIPDTEKLKVIEQFYRTGNEETRQTKGTGLGLYIVDKIVDAHKGNLKIYNNYPQGTKIAITLPSKQIS
jgi:two-component system, OmpR family, phosphate regulon sensor histidine kinase PhoR